MNRNIRRMITLLFLLAATNVVTYAADAITEIPKYAVSVNGIEIHTSQSQYPVLSYKGVTYFPMTSDFANAMGLSVTWQNDTGLAISKNDTAQQFKEAFLGAHNNLGTKVKASISTFPIIINGKKIDNNNEPFPILSYKSVTYFPMTWRYAVSEFGWNTLWDNNKGLSITTQNSGEITPTSDGSTSEVVKGTVKKQLETYVGELKDGVPNGYGTCTYYNGTEYMHSEGDVYTGQWKDGKKHGKGKMVYGSFALEGNVYEGDWYNDKEEGYGVRASSRDKYEGEWKNGEFDGIGTYTCEGYTYTGGYKEGHQYGQGVLVEAEGRRVEGTRNINGLLDGPGYYRYASGEEYTGEFVNGKFEGQGKILFPNGTEYVGGFSGNKYNGHGIMKDASGWVYDGNFVNNLREGKGKCTYASGFIEEGIWSRDVLIKSTN